jgi:hypothetical protein
MIVYNVTTQVERSLAGAWLLWMREEHIPAIIKTGCFSHAVIYELLEPEEADAATYVVQYHSNRLASYEEYIRHYADDMRKEAIEKWGDAVISFRTVMRLVH